MSDGAGTIGGGSGGGGPVTSNTGETFKSSGETFKSGGTGALDAVKKPSSSSITGGFGRAISTFSAGMKDNVKTVGDGGGLTSTSKGLRESAETLLGGKEGFKQFEAALKVGGKDVGGAIEGLKNAKTVADLKKTLGEQGFKELADRLGMSPDDLARKLDAGLNDKKSLQDTIAERMRANEKGPVRKAGLALREGGLEGDAELGGPVPGDPAKAAPGAAAATPEQRIDALKKGGVNAPDPNAPDPNAPDPNAPDPAAPGGNNPPAPGGNNAPAPEGNNAPAPGDGGGDAVGGGNDAGGPGGAGGAEGAGGAQEAGEAQEDPELEKLLDAFVEALLKGDIPKVLEILQQLLPKIEQDPQILEKLAKKIEDALAQQQGAGGGDQQQQQQQQAQGAGGDQQRGGGVGMQILQQLMAFLKQQQGAQQAA